MDIFTFILISFMIVYLLTYTCRYKFLIDILNSDKNKELTEDTLIEDYKYYLKKYNIIESEKDIKNIVKFNEHIEFYIDEKLDNKKLIMKYKKINKKLEKIYKDKFKTIIAYNESHKII